MTQIGTTAFDAEKFCMPHTLALMGTKDVPEALSSYTDGYKAELTGTVAQTMEAGSEMSLCFMGDEAGNMICAGAKAGDEEGQMKEAGLVAMAREEMMAAKDKGMVMGAEGKVTFKDGKAPTVWLIGADQGLTMEPAQKDGAWPADMLMKDKTLKCSWYQPKDAKTYTIPRYVAGDKVSSWAHPFTPAEEGEEVKAVECMKGVSLSGAVTLTAASLTAAAISLF